MYLKSLSAKGFKSFADRIEIDFEKGITAIVGPNGSGKSNITDAVRWVLGEQSPHNLRGGRMEDVIFSGSATRRPVSMAEVTLTFDNSEGIIPVNSAEIVLTRRVSGDGSSEYFINRKSCRLLDISEMLSDIGLGKENNAVIGQNKLEEVLNSRPAERRLFIEEAAGLLKFRKRRERAIRKLSDSEIELSRLNDINNEIRRQIKPLEKQACFAVEHREASGELRELKIREIVTDLHCLEEKWQITEKNLNELNEQLCELRDSESGMASVASKLKEKVKELSLKKDSLSAEETETVRIQERISGNIGLITYICEESRKRAHNRTSEESLKAEMHRKELEQLTVERESLERDFVDTKEELNRAINTKTEISEKIGNIQNEISNLESKCNEIEINARRKSDETDSFQAQAEACGEDWRNCSVSILNHRKRAEKARLALCDSIAESNGKAELVESMDKERRKLCELIESIQNKINLLEADYKTLNEIRLNCLAKAEAIDETLKVSMGIIPDGELKKQIESKKGVIGFLDSMLQVEERWIYALSSFLSSNKNAIISESLDEGIEIYRSLQENTEEIAVFSIEKVENRSGETVFENDPMNEKVFKSLDFIRSDEILAGFLEKMFSGVFFTESLGDAIEAARKHEDFVFVSVDGTIVTHDSIIKRQSSNRTARTLELKAERDRYERKCKSIDTKALEKEIGTLGVVLNEKREELLRLTEYLSEARSAHDSHTAKQREAEETVRNLSQSLGIERRRKSSLEESIREKSQLAKAARRKLFFENRRISRLRSELRDVKSKKDELESLIEEANDRISSLSTKSAVLGERIEGKRNAERKLKNEIDILTRESLKSATAKMVLGRAESALKSLLNTESHIELFLADISNQKCDTEQVLAETEGELEKNESLLNDIREKIRHEENEIGTVGIEREGVRVRVEDATKKILDDYEMPLDFVLREYEPFINEEKSLKRNRIKELENIIKELGPVNPHAESEYDALSQRYALMQEQLQDMKNARSELRKVIRSIEEAITSRFMATFDIVDANFQEVFGTFFPNGKACLILTEPEDILNAGIDIKVQPFGKKLTKISLLSGGETALASLAFLFAIFMIKPSPFYFLDEVEAALDDVNLKRFLDVVKDFKNTSQLILVTHQKRTMESADILYGVSMHGDGVSKVISRKLAEISDGNVKSTA